MNPQRVEEGPGTPQGTASSTVAPEHQRGPQPQQPPTAAVHPAQVPYQHFQYVQPVNPPQTARFVPFDKTWYWIKMGLIIASIVSCIVSLALSIAISTGTDDVFSISITIFWVAPLVAIAGIWDVAELITLCACGKRHGSEARQGIHPGAHVGVDLIIWLAGVLCTFLTAIAYVGIDGSMRTCLETLQDENKSLYYYDYCTQAEYDTLAKGIYLPALKAIMVFLALLTVLHFVIFVRACVETNQRNKARRTYMMAPPLMYYAQPPGAAPYGNAYPMSPPQAHMGQPATSVANEKSAATQPMNASSNFAGYYAPPTAAPAVAPHA